jgi:hypothetical protein
MDIAHGMTSTRHGTSVATRNACSFKKRTSLVERLDRLVGVGLVLERDKGVASGATALVTGGENHRDAAKEGQLTVPSSARALKLCRSHFTANLVKVLLDLLLGSLQVSLGAIFSTSLNLQ